ncbi:MAG: hypothetical protein HKN47_09525 [Pirellulaceae bacterium]|nr:hypothetical protein [Pirellulaceae bacterium]
MAARDDSVIRGSLIACMILLVLSLALNYFFWRWGDVQSQQASSKQSQLDNAQNEIRTLSEQIITFKEMLGVEVMSEEKFNSLANSSSGDAEMDLIATNFVRDMSYFGQEADAQTKNYPNLPEFFVNAIRSRNEQYGQARDEATQIRSQADSDVQNARQAQKVAEDNRKAADRKLEDEQKLFTEDRTRMNQEKEETRDSLTKTVREFTSFRKKKSDETTKLTQKADQLTNTIETQRQQLNRLRSDKFETTQGVVRYVMHGGNVCTINLGAADALRPGVTFGVIDADETRLEDAKVKATLQVTKIRGQHLAEARVVARPSVESPIIEGDKIYSPFWKPGMTVKIALAGDIDIDGDGQPDNDAIRGMITAAGAEVAATIATDGSVDGNLDASIRFLVIGESPEISARADAASAEAAARTAAAMGMVKQKATELGLTVIPAWKLQAYLKTIDDTVTTPLGSAVRGEDFPPEKAFQNSRLPIDLPDMYKQDTSKLQKDNKVLPP